ncbi:hypothetical protein QFZ79_001870 [Arthrobacter sp. V4I6]|uniref:hypothetical protein n=1 Tax=unclassified Arthrobacter TaxID=235627 RepID=UPI0027812C96|nr:MULTISPECIES: hypothetical protein [unclassified Arthrobacter]MDQ0819580.1 hypothetical protein [Arthrobacter sp. V1I7]MDQ0853759.1 hypothetical protein [Arthrobacter sp. V4I6]
MDWTSPVPLSADDDAGTTWLVRRAWPDRTPGDYVLEVLTPGRPGRAAVAAERCAQLDILLDAGAFVTPRILSRRSQDVIVFSAIPGPTLYEVDSTTDDESFARAWEKWSRAWAGQVSGSKGPAAQGVLNNLPLHSAELEATRVWRLVDLWLHHN